MTLRSAGQGQTAAQAVDSFDLALKAARSKLEEAKEAVTVIEAAAKEATPEVDALWKDALGQLRSQANSVESQLGKASDALRSAQAVAMRKTYGDLERARIFIAEALQEQMTNESKTSDQLFESFGGDTDGGISSGRFAELLDALPERPQGVDADTLFHHLARARSDSDGGAPGATIMRESFLKMLQVVYKVSKSTVLTEAQDVKSKMLRRVDVGEFVEGIGGKQKDDTGVLRLPCKALVDGADGWVTSMGSKGAVFLEPRGDYYACVLETPMTDGLSVGEAQTIRKIAKGEVLEIVESEQRDASVGVMRVRVKAGSDGEVGWVSIAGNAGTSFLEPC